MLVHACKPTSCVWMSADILTEGLPSDCCAYLVDHTKLSRVTQQPYVSNDALSWPPYKGVNTYPLCSWSGV